MNKRYSDFKKHETGLYDEIRELSEGLDRLYKEGKDPTDTIHRLEAVLEEFLLFRQQPGQRPAKRLNKAIIYENIPPSTLRSKVNRLNPSLGYRTIIRMNYSDLLKEYYKLIHI